MIIDSGCNQDCVHCFLGQKRNKTPTSQELIKSVGDALSKRNLVIDPYPTEPLMNEDSFEAYSWFRPPLQKIFLTSGTAPLARLQVNSLTEKFKEYGYKDIWVSLHGSTAEKHEIVTRTSGSFERVLEFMHKLRQIAENDHKIRLSMNLCVHKENIPELAGILELAVQNRIEHVYMIRLFKTPDNEVPSRLLMNHQALCDALAEISQLRIKYSSKVYIQMSQTWGINFHNPRIYHYLATTLTPVCIAAAPRFTVHPGRKKIYPCNLLVGCPDLQMGTLEGEDHEIHFNSLGEKLLKWHQEWEERARGSCALDDCSYSGLCHGSCRAMVVAPSLASGSNLDWFAPFPDCITRLLEEIS
ncbi:MAG: SPASM domain-containing protein [Candidatus Odinarchaeota archaeon]